MSINARYNNILNTILDFGELMIACGGEINRVEDTMCRLGLSYGFAKMNVFAVTTNVIVTMIDSDGEPYTQSRRMPSISNTDFSKLERLNTLSRLKCNGKINECEFEMQLKEVKETNADTKKIYIGSMIAAGAFAVFFGGSVYDAVAAVVFAILIHFLQSKCSRYCPNTIIFNLLSSFVVGLCICTVSKVFVKLDAEKIMIGDIMLMIPGIAFTNSIRNMLVGDTLTGVMRMVETVLWSAALGFGFVLSIMLIGV